MAIEAITQTTIREVEVLARSPFYIPMTRSAARPRRAFEHDETFAVLDSHGGIGTSADVSLGVLRTRSRIQVSVVLAN